MNAKIHSIITKLDQVLEHTGYHAERPKELPIQRSFTEQNDPVQYVRAYAIVPDDGAGDRDKAVAAWRLFHDANKLSLREAMFQREDGGFAFKADAIEGPLQENLEQLANLFSAMHNLSGSAVELKNKHDALVEEIKMLSEQAGYLNIPVATTERSTSTKLPKHGVSLQPTPAIRY